MGKEIKLLDDGEVFKVFRKPYDLYDTYNDWVGAYQDMKNDPQQRRTYELMEEIRDYYLLVFKQIKGGDYTLADFEKKAAEILGFAI